MNKAVRVVVALLFVAGLGVALALPILQSDTAPAADDEPARRPRRTRTTAPPKPTPTPEPPRPSPSPSPTPSPTPTEAVAANRFATPYPEHCLDAVAPPTGTGSFAAFDGSRVSIEPAGGGEPTTFRVEPPIAWSPTGDVLATGGGKLWTASGERDGHLFATEQGQWAWSPVANCAIQGSSEGIVASSIHGPDKLLTSISAVDLTISPDGTRLAFLHEDDSGAISLLFGNLRKGTLREGLPPTEDATIALHGWAPDGVTVLYSLIEDQSSAGETLLGVASGEGPEAFSGDDPVPASNAVDHCGSGLLGVVFPGNRRTNQLAYLAAGEEPDYLTGDGFVYGSPSCSPDGAFAVAVRRARGDARRLVLLQPDDGSENVLTSGDYNDEYTEWADGTTAVMLVRDRRGEDPQVWFLQGSAAQPTGLTLSPSVAYYGSPGWSAVLDWSATAPTGAPAG